MMRPGLRIKAATWRKISQLLGLLLFFFLLIRTDYGGSDELAWAVNLLFRIDPFLALSAMLAAKTVIVLMLPALGLLGLTLVFGRFFCGMLCPLGTLIDWSGRLAGPVRRPTAEGRGIKYALLLFLLTASCFGLPLSGYLDPFSLLVRGMAFSLHPGLGHGADTLFTWTYQQAPAWVNAVTEPVYGLLRDHVLPFGHKVYGLSVLCLAMLVLVLAATRLGSRFFCRTICPLGALLAWTARSSLLRLRGGSEECGQCRRCHEICPMAAIAPDRSITAAECTLCLDCVSHCPRSRFTYGLRTAKTANPPFDLSRRTVLATLAGGALAPLSLPSRPLARQTDPQLIRPPGALAEPEFLARCLRCGECIKVCIGNGLHAAWTEAGMEGLFTPRLIGRLGYCEFNCTLCGQVCPSGALRRLSREEKQVTVIGRAHFDRNRCLPYASGVACIVCEEHCPIPDKAIRFREVQTLDTRGTMVWVRQPYVVEELCTGCGICENRCPLPGQAAILVTSAGESRHPGPSLIDGY